MKVFISHAQKDQALARQLRDRLARAGFAVWDPDEEIALGDNWAKKMGKALDDAELMVILLTPSAMKSELLRRDVEFVLGARKFEGRLLSVFVGPAIQAERDVPWILLELPHVVIESARNFGQVVKKIQAIAMASLSVGMDL